MSRSIAVVVVGVVEPVPRAKEEASKDKDRGQGKQN